MWPWDVLSGKAGIGSLAGSGDAAPSEARFGPSSLAFDNSDWTVSTGSSSAGARIHPLVLAGLGLLALLTLWRLTKKS